MKQLLLLAVFILLLATAASAERVDVGDVTIWNDDFYLYVKYDSAKDWSFDETKLLMGESADKIIDIPQYEVIHNAAESYTYKILLAGAPQDIYVVAQAQITHPEKGTHKTVWEIGEVTLKQNSKLEKIKEILANAF